MKKAITPSDKSKMHFLSIGGKKKHVDTDLTANDSMSKCSGNDISAG